MSIEKEIEVIQNRILRYNAVKSKIEKLGQLYAVITTEAGEIREIISSLKKVSTSTKEAKLLDTIKDELNSIIQKLGNNESLHKFVLSIRQVVKELNTLYGEKKYESYEKEKKQPK